MRTSKCWEDSTEFSNPYLLGALALGTAREVCGVAGELRPCSWGAAWHWSICHTNECTSPLTWPPSKGAGGPRLRGALRQRRPRWVRWERRWPGGESWAVRARGSVGTLETSAVRRGLEPECVFRSTTTPTRPALLGRCSLAAVWLSWRPPCDRTCGPSLSSSCSGSTSCWWVWCVPMSVPRSRAWGRAAEPWTLRSLGQSWPLRRSREFDSLEKILKLEPEPPAPSSEELWKRPSSLAYWNLVS